MALAVGAAEISDLVTQQPQHVLAAGRHAGLGGWRGGDSDGAGGGVHGEGLHAGRQVDGDRWVRPLGRGKVQVNGAKEYLAGSGGGRAMNYTHALTSTTARWFMLMQWVAAQGAVRVTPVM